MSKEELIEELMLALEGLSEIDMDKVVDFALFLKWKHNKNICDKDNNKES